MKLKTKVSEIIKQQSENKSSGSNNYVVRIHNVRAEVASGKDQGFSFTTWWWAPEGSA